MQCSRRQDTPRAKMWLLKAKSTIEQDRPCGKEGFKTASPSCVCQWNFPFCVPRIEVRMDPRPAGQHVFELRQCVACWSAKAVTVNAFFWQHETSYELPHTFLYGWVAAPPKRYYNCESSHSTGKAYWMPLSAYDKATISGWCQRKEKRFSKTENWRRYLFKTRPIDTIIESDPTPKFKTLPKAWEWFRNMEILNRNSWS